MAYSGFHIRETGRVPDDAVFILAAFDSALPHLESVGSGQQWGSQPFSSIPARANRAHDLVSASEAHRVSGAGEALRTFIAEKRLGDGPEQIPGDDGLSIRTDDNEGGARYLAVAAAVVRERWWPESVTAEPHLKPIMDAANAEGNPFYLYMLISDFRTGAARKGAGAALVQRVREYAVSGTATSLFVDCWAGNGGNLVKFYIAHGFVPVGDFVAERPGMEDYHGTVLRMEIAQE